MAAIVETSGPEIRADRSRRSGTLDRRVLVVAWLAVIVLALWTSAQKGIWTDESYSLLTSDRSLAGTWQQALHFELQPPTYFLLLNAWLRLGGTSVEWARAFSTLCVLGCIGILWVATRPFDRARGIPAPIVAAVTATCIWAAAEARDYALVLLLSALSYWLLLRLVSGQSARPMRDAIWYAVVAYAALLTMYYTGFLLLGQWAGAMTVRRARRFVTGALAAVAVAFIPWLGLVVRQVNSHLNVNAPFAVDVAQAHLPGGAVAVVFRDLLGALFAAAPVLNRPFVALALAALLAIVPAIAGRRVGDPRAASELVRERVLVIALVVASVSLITLRVFNISLVLPRHMAAITPGFLLLWSMWVGGASSMRRAWWASACLLVPCAITLVSYVRGADVADSRGAAAYIAQRSSGDPVLVVGPEAVFPFRYYYRGQDNGTGGVFGVPIDASLQSYNPDPIPLTAASQIESRLHAAGGRNQFWIVVSKPYIWKSDTADTALRIFLRSHDARDSADFKNLFVMRARY